MTGFQIPGLGQAKPNETLPPLRVDPLPAAASPAPVADPAILPDAVPIDQAQEPPRSAEPSPIETDQRQSSTQTQDGSAHIQVLPDQGSMVVEAQSDQASGAAQGQSDGGPMVLDRPESPPSLTSALEAAIGGLQDTDMTQDEPQAQPSEGAQPETVELQPDQGENPEWEVDSSPYESSSDSSSSDSSDSDSDGEQYELLGVEETARLLMETEGAFDDEGDKRDRTGSAVPLRTKNELPDEAIPKPDVTITPDMKVEELGSVEHIVQGTILIKAITPGEYQVLDTGSVLCTQDLVVIGIVAETIGKVLQPRYTVRFSSQDEIDGFGVAVGTKIFYPVDHASYVFTEPLRGLKGSDASNIHDEEVAADEVEFSDDEKEAEHKRAHKNRRHKDKGPGEGGRNGRGPHPLRHELAPDAILNYDDGPYNPLARPPGFGSGFAQGEDVDMPPRPPSQRDGGRRGDRRGRGGGRGGRGGRGRDSGRGGGQGGQDQFRDGHSLPPRGYQHPSPSQQPSNPWPSSNPPAPTSGPPAPTSGPAPAMPAFGFNWPQQVPHQSPGAPATSQPPPLPPPGWPLPGPTQGQQAVNGTFVNPALIAALMKQMQGQVGQQPWAGQPPPLPPPPPSGGWS